MSKQGSLRNCGTGTLVLLLLLHSTTLPALQVGAAGPSACQNISGTDAIDYSLLHAPVLHQLRLFSGEASTGSLNADALKELTAFSTSIALHIQELAQSPLGQQLLVLNHMRRPQIARNSYTVAVTNDDQVGAWSCEDGSSSKYQMRISSAFFQKALETSVKQAIALANHPPGDEDGMVSLGLSFDDELLTPKDVIGAALKLNPSAKQEGDPEWHGGAGLDFYEKMGLREDLSTVELLAALQYVKALAFVIGHESSHMWVDGCAEDTSESRADDFGLLFSSLLFDEQIVHALLYNSSILTTTGFRQRYQTFRQVARKRLAEAPNTTSTGLITPDLQVCYQTWAHLSDTALEKRSSDVSKVAVKLFEPILTEMPPYFREPVSRKGYEIFTTVYEDLGVQEFITGVANHGGMASRKERLAEKYPGESKVVTRVLGQLMQQKVRVSQKVADDRNAYMESFLEPVLPPNACIARKQAKPPSDDPCLSPPPDGEDFDELTSSEEDSRSKKRRPVQHKPHAKTQ